MKKIIAIILILAVILPSAALSEELYIAKHYSILINSHELITGKGSASFDFDSLTIDLYIKGDGESGYLNITRCIAGIFLNDGMLPVRIVTIGGEKYIVSDSGSNLTLREDEGSNDLWISYGNSYFKLHYVEPFNLYSDLQ